METAASTSGLEFYKSARAELIERIRLRDQSLMFFLGAAGVVLTVIFGVDASASRPVDLALSIPLIGIGVAAMVAQHNSVIGRLGEYCATEIGPSLAAPYGPVQWDASATLRGSQTEATVLRAIAHICVLVIPDVLALYLSLPRLETVIEHPAWIAASLMTLFTLGLLVWSSLLRVRIWASVFKSPGQEDRNRTAPRSQSGGTRDG